MENLGFAVLAVAIIVLIFWYLGSRPQSTIRHFEDKTEDFLSIYRTQRMAMYGDDELPDEVLLMQDFYIRLREKYRHTPQETAKCAEDWMRYVVQKNSVDTNFYLDLDDDHSASTEEDRQNRIDKMKEGHAIAEEIENRFAEQLGTTAKKKLAELREKQEKESREHWDDDVDRVTI